MDKAGQRRIPIEQRRRELLEAAIRVMKRDGVQAATTRAITSEAGMPHGAFRFCFDGKIDMFQQIISIDRDSLARHAVHAMETSPSIESAISRALTGYWRESRADRGLQQVYQELSLLALRDNLLLELETQEIRAYVTQLATTLDEMAERYAVSWDMDTHDMALILYSLVNGLTMSWLFTGSSVTLDRGIEDVIGAALSHVSAE